MTTFTTPAHYTLDSLSGAMFPWPCRDEPLRETYISPGDTLLRADANRFMVFEPGNVRAFVHIPDSRVIMTRQARGDIEANRDAEPMKGI